MNHITYPQLMAFNSGAVIFSQMNIEAGLQYTVLILSIVLSIIKALKDLKKDE